MEKKSSVCVTGAAGYIGSWLVKKLLEKGYIVHATLRNLNDPLKVGILRGLPHAEERLELFQADINEHQEFEPAIQGCEFVFHVATPILPSDVKSSEGTGTTEAAVVAVKSIIASCKRSQTGKRLVYTGSIMSASPLKEGASGFKDSIDELCWTPLPPTFAHFSMIEQVQDYINSKTISEKEALRGSSSNAGEKLEVVSLACGLVGGDTLLPYLPGSVEVVVSLLTGRKETCRTLKLFQEMFCSVPLIHIEDVTEAHLFCIEQQPSVEEGRYICVGVYPTIAEMANYFTDACPGIQIAEIFSGELGAEVKKTSSKLKDIGFECKYALDLILRDSIECAKRLGAIK